LLNSRGLQIYPHVPRIGKMGSSQGPIKIQTETLLPSE
jgi:hypothetical protein